MELIYVDAFHRVWERLESWLVTHAPDDHAALRPPATAEGVTALEGRLGFPLHPEFRALLGHHDGVDDPGAGGVSKLFRPGAFLPLGHRLIGLDGITSQYDGIVVELAEEDSADRPVAYAGFFGGDTRGDALGAHIRRWVPFAMVDDGEIAFVDHRLGPSYGCVHAFGVESGGWPPVKWAHNLTDLFDRLAGSLESGEPFQGLRPRSHE